MRKWTIALFALALPALAAEGPTPAQIRIAQAEAALASAPDDAARLADLALGYARRARETADMSWYERAHEALDRALDAEPEHFQALRTRVWTLLGQHEFARARELAQELNRRAPDDVLVYGMIADAAVEMGDYEAAVDAVQWMLDLHPGNVPALTRAAYLRELHGYIEGAVEFMRLAFDRTPGHEREDRAWILTQVAHLERSRGRVADAEAAAVRALELFPGYHYALAEMGKLRQAQGRTEEALAAFRQRYASAPHPENLLDVARALAAAGRSEDAAPLFAQFEAEALEESDGADNCNRELIFYLADEGAKPGEALRLAEAEIARRDDLHTRHAYAWALHRAGRAAEAWAAMERALVTGYRDAEFLHRAGAVAWAAGQNERAVRLWRDALELNPAAPTAAETRRMLAEAHRGESALRSAAR